MLHKLTDHIPDVLSAGGCIATIWGMTLADIDLVSKIFWTSVVSLVTVYSLLRKKKQ